MAGIQVPAPQARRFTGGLFAVAPPVEAAEPHEFYGGVEFQSQNCGVSSDVPDMCLDAYISLVDDNGTVTVILVNGPAGDYEATFDGGAPDAAAGPDPEWSTSLTPDEEHTVVVYGDDGLEIGTLTWETATGETTTTTNGVKQFDGIDWFHGTPFALYKGVECGMSEWREYAPRAQSLLEAGTQRVVEEKAWTEVFPSLAVDLTPVGGPVDAATAIGILEEYAADRYSSIGVLHAGFRLTNLMMSQFLIDPVSMSTINGTPVANGLGYTSLVGPAGEATTGAWLYITGQLIVRLSPIMVAEAPAYATNRYQALAERKAIVRPECIVAAIQVEVGGAESG